MNSEITQAVYKDKDLDFLRAVSVEAESLWCHLAKSHPDFGQGSCIMGEGFKILFLPKGKRRPREMFIARASGAICGSLAWEATKKEIDSFLKSKGIVAYFCYGRMD